MNELGSAFSSKRLIKSNKNSTVTLPTRQNTYKPASVPIIGAKRKEREIALFFELLENNVYIAPGEAFYSDEEGWFRIVFAVNWPILEEGLKRMKKVLDSRMESSFGHLGVD